MYLQLDNSLYFASRLKMTDLDQYSASGNLASKFAKKWEASSTKYFCDCDYVLKRFT